MMRFLFALTVWLLGLAGPGLAQQLNNDGFQRRNGQMHVLRNGQLRPMTRDAHLPTGTVVTKDGFVVSREGRRTELREGQGCDLRGRVVAVVPAAGGLALAAPRRAAAEEAPSADRVGSLLADLFGGGRYDEYDGGGEHGKKAAEKARERRKKEEEWRREMEKKREEYVRERGKKWKEKWKKDKGWDD